MQTTVTNIAQVPPHTVKMLFLININKVPIKKKKKFVTNGLAVFAK